MLKRIAPCGPRLLLAVALLVTLLSACQGETLSNLIDSASGTATPAPEEQGLPATASGPGLLHADRPLISAANPGPLEEVASLEHSRIAAVSPVEAAALIATDTDRVTDTLLWRDLLSNDSSDPLPGREARAYWPEDGSVIILILNNDQYEVLDAETLESRWQSVSALSVGLTPLLMFELLPTQGLLAEVNAQQATLDTASHLLVLRDLETGEGRAAIDVVAGTMRFSPNGAWLLSSDSQGTSLNIISLATGLPSDTLFFGRLTAFEWLPDGQRFITFDAASRRVDVFDLASGDSLESWSINGEVTGATIAPQTGQAFAYAATERQDAPVNSGFLITPGLEDVTPGSFPAVGGIFAPDGSLLLLQARLAETRFDALIPGDTAPRYSVAMPGDFEWLADSALLALYGLPDDDGYRALRLINAQTGAELLSLPRISGRLHWIAGGLALGLTEIGADGNPVARFYQISS